MRTNALLKEFLAEECDAAVREKLIAEITQHGAARANVVREFAFNRFNIRIDFEGEEVRIEDDLDTREQGSCSISLAEFAATLNSHEPTR